MDARQDQLDARPAGKGTVGAAGREAPLRVLYVSELAEPEAHDLGVYAGLEEGEDDVGWVSTRLSELGLAGAVDLHAVRVCVGEALPPAHDFDAAVVGGSYHMVGEDRPWQRAILRWLGEARRAPRPLLGICGGHQLMARYFGAEVGPLAGGTWSESAPVTPTAAGARHWLLADLGADTVHHFACSEHVLGCPGGATVLAAARHSPAIALDYGAGWVSVQWHPEMSAEGMRRSWAVSAPERAARYTDSPRAARVLGNFLARARAARSA